MNVMASLYRTVSSYGSIARALSSGGLFGRASLFVSLISIPLRKKLAGRKARPLTLTFEGNTFAFWARDAADIAVLREVFLEREYDLGVDYIPERILDIGAHIGASAIFFTLKYPQAKVTSYEPDPSNYELLVKNTSAFSGITCVNAAVAGKSGTVILHSRDSSSISGTIIEGVSSAQGTKSGIEVRSLSLDDAISNAGGQISLVKFDVEGAEYEVFSKILKLGQANRYLGELHLDLMPGKTKDDFCSIFKGFDVSERKISDRRYIISAEKR